eukprot:4520526-Karenia_brevis.AAC.1
MRCTAIANLHVHGEPIMYYGPKILVETCNTYLSATTNMDDAISFRKINAHIFGFPVQQQGKDLSS